MQTSTPSSHFQEWERGWALPGRCQSTLASPGLSWCQLWIQLPILPRVPPWETQAQQHKEPFSSPAGSSHGPHSVPGAGPRQVGSAALSWIQSLSQRWDPDGSHGFIHSIPVIHNALVSRQGLHLPLPQTLQLPRLCSGSPAGFGGAATTSTLHPTAASPAKDCSSHSKPSSHSQHSGKALFGST